MFGKASSLGSWSERQRCCSKIPHVLSAIRRHTTARTYRATLTAPRGVNINNSRTVMKRASTHTHHARHSVKLFYMRISRNWQVLDGTGETQSTNAACLEELRASPKQPLPGIALYFEKTVMLLYAADTRSLCLCIHRIVSRKLVYDPTYDPTLQWLDGSSVEELRQ